mmetsp:Transcript_30720/g.48330  ORF Transcript_30720/g.48330 Transcript_30720/m.48330 type:complete len:251 (-) Transcript_30720:141-893(-)
MVHVVSKSTAATSATPPAVEEKSPMGETATAAPVAERALKRKPTWTSMALYSWSGITPRGWSRRRSAAAARCRARRAPLSAAAPRLGRRSQSPHTPTLAASWKTKASSSGVSPTLTGLAAPHSWAEEKVGRRDPGAAPRASSKAPSISSTTRPPCSAGMFSWGHLFRWPYCGVLIRVQEEPPAGRLCSLALLFATHERTSLPSTKAPSIPAGTGTSLSKWTRTAHRLQSCMFRGLFGYLSSAPNFVSRIW